MSFLNLIHGTNCAVGIFKTITYNGFGLGEVAEPKAKLKNKS